MKFTRKNERTFAFLRKGTVMENTKRQSEILNYLKQTHFASVSELASVIYTSEATVRRDIQKLESKGALKSVYGGVVITEYQNSPVPIFLRDKENSASKERIAEKAAELVRDSVLLAEIIIPEKSNPVERYAAEELVYDVEDVEITADNKTEIDNMDKILRIFLFLHYLYLSLVVQLNLSYDISLIL